MSDAHYPIQMAARLTGLSTHVIRIWEQRYGAVAPHRSSANHRLYSADDIDRLGWLRDATRAGHPIGRMARLPNEELRALAAGPGLPRPSSGGAGADTFLEAALAAIEALDAGALDRTLQEAVTALGGQGVLHGLLAPLLQTVGERWREGKLTAAHEHFATLRMRAFLARGNPAFSDHPAAPALIVATPSGQLHEMGALLVAALAANLGWNVTCLGASLPAAEIAGAARRKQARAVALSLVYPEDDVRLAEELERLRESLPAEAALLVGGRAAAAYRDSLTRIGALLVEDLAQLGQALDRLRRRPQRSTL